MIITSMNMYEFSERTNREMGVLIDAVQDKTLYDKATAEVISIIQSAAPINLSGHRETEKTSSYKPQPEKKHQGFCTRCEDKIRYNPDSPYCSDCYSSWKHWNNYYYEENVCHRCGEEENSTMAKPQCADCFEEWRGGMNKIEPSFGSTPPRLFLY